MDNINRLSKFTGVAFLGTAVSATVAAPALKAQWDINHNLPAALSQETVSALLMSGLGVFVVSMLAAWAVSRR
jgi:hypothetical protein